MVADRSGANTSSSRRPMALPARQVVELDHRLVPGGDDAVVAHGHDPDVDALHDVLVVRLEGLELVRLGLERRVEPGVFQGDGGVAGDHAQELQVLGGQEGVLGPLAQGDDADGLVAVRHGLEVEQGHPRVFLAQRHLFRPGLLLDDGERQGGHVHPGDQEGVGDLEPLAVRGRAPEAAIGQQVVLLGLLGVTQENGDRFHLERLVHPFDDGGGDGLHAAFGADGVAELDEGLAVFVLVLVKEPVDLLLNPPADGREQEGHHERRDGDGERVGLGEEKLQDHAAEADQQEVDAQDGGAGDEIGRAALEQDVHVHEPVLHNGIGEGDGQEDEAEDGGLHQRVDV